MVACAAPSAAVPDGQHPSEDRIEVELAVAWADGPLLPHDDIIVAANKDVPPMNPLLVRCLQATSTYCRIWNARVGSQPTSEPRPNDGSACRPCPRLTRARRADQPGPCAFGRSLRRNAKRASGVTLHELCLTI